MKKGLTAEFALPLSQSKEASLYQCKPLSGCSSLLSFSVWNLCIQGAAFVLNIRRELYPAPLDI